MKKLLLLVVMSAFILASCTKDDIFEPLVAGDSVTDEEYDIYSFIIEEHFSGIEEIVVDQRTTVYYDLAETGSMMQQMMDEITGLDTTLFDNYKTMNTKTYSFENQFNVDEFNIVLLSGEDMASLFNVEEDQDPWSKFIETYPNASGTIEFSRIGFSLDGLQAVVEMGFNFNGDGAGFIFYLEKEGDDWVVKKTYPTWNS